MKQRIQDEGFIELSAKCGRLKMRSADGKMRTTDAGDTETILRIVQSIPSPKAEPFKQWLAKVATERLQEDAHQVELKSAWSPSTARRATPRSGLADACRAFCIVLM